MSLLRVRPCASAGHAWTLRLYPCGQRAARAGLCGLYLRFAAPSVDDAVDAAFELQAKEEEEEEEEEEDENTARVWLGRLGEKDKSASASARPV